MVVVEPQKAEEFERPRNWWRDRRNGDGVAEGPRSRK
jgi:hypothetical protein